jgi:hypothetical protein
LHLLVALVALEDYLAIDAGMARQDHIDVVAGMEVLELVDREVDASKAGVIDALAEERDLLVGRDVFLHDLAQPLVRGFESPLVLG